MIRNGDATDHLICVNLYVEYVCRDIPSCLYEASFNKAYCSISSVDGLSRRAMCFCRVMVQYFLYDRNFLFRCCQVDPCRSELGSGNAPKLAVSAIGYWNVGHKVIIVRVI